jgi:hypothetical protein
MLTSALFFSHWLGRSDKWSIRCSVESGALAGLAAIMRWQDAIFLAIPIFESLRLPGTMTRRVTAALGASIAWLVVFSPQMAVWHVLYGRWLAVPQGPSFMQWTAPHLGGVLVSFGHGLFSWTPILALSVMGLMLFAVRHRRVALPLVAIVLIAWYVNAAVADWWAGEAFGARRFLSLYPLFVVGLAEWIGPERLRPGRAAVACLLVGLNWLLLLQYEVFMKGHTTLAPYPVGWFNLWVARFVVPFRLLARVWRHFA